MLVRDAGGFSEGGSGADNAKCQSQHLFCGLSLQNLDKEHKGKITKDNSQGFGFLLFICLNNWMKIGAAAEKVHVLGK